MSTTTAKVVNNHSLQLIKFEELIVLYKNSNVKSPGVDVSFIGNGAKVVLDLGLTYNAYSGYLKVMFTLRLEGFSTNEVDIAAIIVQNNVKLKVLQLNVSSSMTFTTVSMLMSEIPNLAVGEKFGLNCYIEAKEIDSETEIQRPLPLSDAFERELGHDATFVIGEDKIGFSKFVLVSSSKVFETMFSNEWLDTKNGEIRIEGIDYRTMFEFVKSLYLRRYEADNILDAFNVYMVADKYDVEFVKSDATKYISKNMKKENFATAREFFLTALKFNIESFKKICADYISANVTNGTVLESLRMAEEYNCDQIRESALAHLTKIRGNQAIKKLPGYVKLNRTLLRLILQRLDM